MLDEYSLSICVHIIDMMEMDHQLLDHQCLLSSEIGVYTRSSLLGWILV
jgi:hypothetical protein